MDFSVLGTNIKQKIVIKWDKDFSLQSQAIESFKNKSAIFFAEIKISWQRYVSYRKK